MKKWRLLLITPLLFLLPFSSWAWGRLGHQVMGEIAEQYLSPRAGKQVRSLLGHESVASVSPWADIIKSNPFYDYLNSWHYINLPDKMSAGALQNYLQNDRSVNLYTRLIFLAGELKSPGLSRKKKILYLKLLIHFVEDAHQPMHVSRAQDRGGNNIKLYWFNRPTNLHRLWDENLLEFQRQGYQAYVRRINLPSAMRVQQWQKQSVQDWIIESYRISEQLYKEGYAKERLGTDYYNRHIGILNTQLLKGGIRLAGLLNELFR